MSEQRQMTLAVELNDNARFENYYVSYKNQLAFNHLRSLTGSNSNNLVYLWGAAFAGKSHLLQAVCHQAELAGNTALYLSLENMNDVSPEILEDCHRLSVVCLDDIQCLAGNVHWEQALFKLFNQLKDSGAALLLSANVNVNDLALSLPDLQSRLQSMLVFNLDSLDDADKKRALQHRAAQRGFDLPDAVADYILVRAGRGFDELMQVLDRLDATTLSQQRKLTVPLVKSTLEW